jgi:hypothetical protein
VTNTEDRLRAALVDCDTTMLGVPAVTAGIRTGIRRRRQRRWAALGTTLATFGAVAVAIPLLLAIDRDAHPAGTGPPAPPAGGALAAAINYAPTWLPAGATEIERIVNQAGRTARVFSAGQRIKVADADARDTVTGRDHESVQVDGRTGVGFPAAGNYELQLPWRTGRWLTVTITNSRTARAEAIRVAASVRTIVPVGIALPLNCAAPVCAGNRIASIYGGPKAWLATIDQGPVELVLSHNYSRPAAPDRRWTAVVHGNQARLSAKQLVVDLGSGQTLTVKPGEHQKVSAAQLLQAANSAWPIITPTYSWLSTSP